MLWKCELSTDTTLLFHRADWHRSLSFHAALSYAVFICLLQRRRYAAVSKAELDERWAALIPPGNLNSASHLRSDAPTVVKLVRWVHDDPAWFSRLPNQVRVPLSWTYYLVKYALFSLPIIHLLAVSERLPGEPPNKFTSDPPDLQDWNFPKAVTSSPEEYKDGDIREAATVPAGEAAPVEALSLHSVEEAIVPAAQIPEMDHIDKATVTEAIGTSIDWSSVKMVSTLR